MRSSTPLALLITSAVALATATGVGLPIHAVESEPTVIATVPVGAGPWGVAITPDSRTAYIGNSGQAGSTSNVSVIDLDTASVTRSIATRQGGAAGITITPNGQYAFVANFTPDGTVSKIDTGSFAVTESARVNSDALSIAASPDGLYVYVVCQFGQTWRVRVSDLDLLRVVTSQTGGTFDIAVNATQQVYVGGAPGGQVGIVGEFSRFATLTSSGTAVALSPDGNTAYVGDTGGRLYVFDLATTAWNTAIATYALGGDIRGIAVTPDGTQAYVTDRVGNVVRVVDLSSGEVLYTIPVGNSPQRVAISANGLTAVVTNNAASTVSIISIPAVSSPVSPGSGIIYETLNLAQSENIRCPSQTVRGAQGEWVGLPGSSDCVVTGEVGQQLLGWATTANFPTEIARRQVINGWGAYETFYPDGGLSGVFIPAAGFTHLTNSITMYPITGRL